MLAGTSRSARSVVDNPWRDRPFGVALDPPGSLARHYRDSLVELAVDVVQPDAVLGRVPTRQRTLGDQSPVRRPPRLVGQVVVYAVAPRQPAKSVAEGIEIVAEGVGRAADVPAQAAGALA